MKPAFSAVVRAVLRHPVSLAVAAGALGMGVAHVTAAGEVALDGAAFSVLSWLGLVVMLAIVERMMGSVRAVLVTAAGTATAVLLAWGVLSTLAALGEQLSVTALQYQPWVPSVTTALLVTVASGSLRPATRRRVRWAAVTIIVAMLLVNGHASDLARAAAVLPGLAAAAWWAPSAAVRPWPAGARSTWRRLVSSALIVLASALALAAVTPDASGILAWTGAAVDASLAPLAAALLLVSALLIDLGRIVGVVLAGAVLVTVAAVVFVEVLLTPLVEGDLWWSGISGGEMEWQIVIALAGVLPALAALSVVIGARAIVRRAAPTATAEDRAAARDAAHALGTGTFAHMATWAGNSVWVGPDGAVVAYRVRGGVAITVGDPICSDRAATVRAFSDFCDQRGWMPVLYSVHAETAADLAGAGWSTMPVGTEAVLATAGFSLSGKRRQDLRTAVNRAARESVEAVWTRYVDLDAAAREQVDRICGRWAQDKALPEMGFTLGGLAELKDEEVRLMLVVGADGDVHAVTSWLPRRRAGVVVGWTLDVMRRAEAAMPGAMEFAIVSTIRQAEVDGIPTISLSGTPLAPHEGAVPGRLSRRVVRALEPAYGFASLERFKAKFGAEHRPLWMCYPEGLQLGRVGSALVRAYVPGLRLRAIFATLKAMA